MTLLTVAILGGRGGQRCLSSMPRFRPSGDQFCRAEGNAELHAADIDPLAVRCAWRNVLPVGGTVHEGDLFDALPARLRGRVQVLAVNAPYVPTEAIRTMPPEARIHEPRISLDGGGDGLEFHRRVAAEASEWLSPGGHVLVETSRRQAAATSSILAAAGLAVRTACSEELDATAVIASRHA